MNPEVLKAIADRAGGIAPSEISRLGIDALADAMTREMNTFWGLFYMPGSDSHGCLYKACYNALWDAAAKKSTVRASIQDEAAEQASVICGQIEAAVYLLDKLRGDPRHPGQVECLRRARFKLADAQFDLAEFMGLRERMRQ